MKYDIMRYIHVYKYLYIYIYSHIHMYVYAHTCSGTRKEGYTKERKCRTMLRDVGTSGQVSDACEDRGGGVLVKRLMTESKHSENTHVVTTVQLASHCNCNHMFRQQVLGFDLFNAQPFWTQGAFGSEHQGVAEVPKLV